MSKKSTPPSDSQNYPKKIKIIKDNMNLYKIKDDGISVITNKLKAHDCALVAVYDP